jgi:hypothetical protein
MTSQDFIFDGVQYEVTSVSDVNREGQGIEVQDPRSRGSAIRGLSY